VVNNAFTKNGAKSNGTLYDLEVAAARVEWTHPLLTADNEELSQEKDYLIQKEVKARKNRRAAQQTLRKLGHQIRGHVKPNSAKKSGIMRVEVELRNDVWKQLTGKEEIEEHLIDRNFEQLSCAGATPFGYTHFGNELDHTGDSPMGDGHRSIRCCWRPTGGVWCFPKGWFPGCWRSNVGVGSI
jgi:hypothetical protein